MPLLRTLLLHNICEIKIKMKNILLILVRKKKDYLIPNLDLNN